MFRLTPTFVLLIGLLAALQGSMIQPPDLEPAIPDFRLRNLDGKSVSLSQLQGDRYTVIDFWATWCGPCINSLPALAKLSDEFADSEVRFVGISVDSPRNLSKVKPFARSMGVSYPVLLDLNSEVMSLLNVTAMPTLFIVDSDREIVFFHEGYRPGDDAVIREALNKLLTQ